MRQNQDGDAAAFRRRCRSANWGLLLAGALLVGVPTGAVIHLGCAVHGTSWASGLPGADVATEDSDKAPEAAVSSEFGDNREGGGAVRAKGEEGSLGNPSSGAPGRRYAIKGPSGAGLGVAGDPNAPTAPWGRDTSLGLSGIGTAGSGLGTGQGFGSGHGRLGGATVRMGAASPPSTQPWRYPSQAWNRDRVDSLSDNPFVRATVDPRSTFSIDVDTAAYSLVRSHLERGSRPPRGAVRIEELVNYFEYNYPQPRGAEPFAVAAEVSRAPWAPQHRLLRIGIQGKKVAVGQRPPANLVFLLDVSGSMQPQNKLPLLKRGLRLLIGQLRAEDRVSIVVYAGASGLVLPSTPGNRHQKILSAIDHLDAGGSTNGGEGIELAYAQAGRSLRPGGINRVVLATDGDFNVGVTSQSALVSMIQEKAKQGIFLSVLGFGHGNYNDSTLEKLADRGNGNYAYIDTLNEARKVLVEQASGTLLTIAKDVKLQLEFNPRGVEAFRLIGYENRVLAHRDFNDDKKDAGELGAGHTVTALYEIIPAGGRVPEATTDGLKYQAPRQLTPAADSAELVTIKLRYKEPDASQSRLLETTVPASDTDFANASKDLRFAASVAAFGMVLRDCKYKGTWSLADVARVAADAAGADVRRRDFISLVRSAQRILRS